MYTLTSNDKKLTIEEGFGLYWVYNQDKPQNSLSFKSANNLRDWVDAYKSYLGRYEECGSIPTDRKVFIAESQPELRLVDCLDCGFHGYRRVESECPKCSKILKFAASVEENKDVFSKVNGSFYVGEHPVNYYAATEMEDLISVDSMYDILEDKWIKKDDDEEELDILNKHKKAAELADKFAVFFDLMFGLARRIIESELEDKNFEKDEKIHKAEKSELEQVLNIIAYFYDRIHKLRKKSFKNKTDLPSRNYSSANIVYKLLDHWGYIEPLSHTWKLLHEKNSLPFNRLSK